MKKLIALLFVLAVLAACAPPAAEVIEKEVIVEKEVPVTVEIEKEVVVEKEVVKVVEVTAVPVVSEYNEAPMLAGLVAAGELRVGELISHRYNWRDSAEAYLMLLADRTQAEAVILDWTE